ncbi:hypothetical protein SLE2022_284510 [Rubroshorea leprosula]
MFWRFTSKCFIWFRKDEKGTSRKQALSWHISFIKSLAEFSRIPIVVTNQVRSRGHNQACQYSFQTHNERENLETPALYDMYPVAALAINWAHAVTICLVLESKSGQRFVKLAKSPLSPPLAFPFHITSSGISLLNHDGIELTGPEIKLNSLSRLAKLFYAFVSFCS